MNIFQIPFVNEYLCLAEELSIKRFLIRDPDFDLDIGSMIQVGISQELINGFA